MYSNVVHILVSYLVYMLPLPPRRVILTSYNFVEVFFVILYYHNFSSYVRL